MIHVMIHSYLKQTLKKTARKPVSVMPGKRPVMEPFEPSERFFCLEVMMVDTKERLCLVTNKENDKLEANALEKINKMEDKLGEIQILNLDSPEVFISAAELICKMVRQDYWGEKRMEFYRLCQGMQALTLVIFKFGENKYPAVRQIMNNLLQLANSALYQIKHEISGKKPPKLYPTKQAIHACEIQLEVAVNMLKEMKESIDPEKQGSCDKWQ